MRHHELAIKAAPLILIAVGLSVCYKANIWNIGAEGQFIFGAIFGSAIPVLFPQFEGPLVLPLMLLLGMFLHQPAQQGRRHNLARFWPQSINTVINNSCAQRIGVQGVVGIVE